MGRKIHFDSRLTYGQHGERFVVFLRAELLSHRYSAAIPIPDVGEDLWFSKEDRSNHRDRVFFQAQVKAGASADRGAKHRTFDFNITLTNLKYSLDQPRYVYFFGICDERFVGLNYGNLDRNSGLWHEEKRTEEATRGYHLGCIPSCLFRRICSDHPGIGELGDRFKFQIDVRIPGPDCKQFEYELVVYKGKHRTNFREPVTKYFRGINAGIDESRSTEKTAP